MEVSGYVVVVVGADAFGVVAHVPLGVAVHIPYLDIVRRISCPDIDRHS